MKKEIQTLDQVVNALLASLDDARKDELRRLIPNPREERARKWMEEVISMFRLNQSGCGLCNDIEQRFPDESIFKGEVFDNAHGIFEAEIILREAREALLTKR